MRAHKVDTNQADIVRWLRKAGASVWDTSQSGRGAPDIVVGYRSKTYLIEVKEPKGKLSPGQRCWHHDWRGHPVVVVRSAEEALLAIGAVK